MKNSYPRLHADLRKRACQLETTRKCLAPSTGVHTGALPFLHLVDPGRFELPSNE